MKFGLRDRLMRGIEGGGAAFTPLALSPACWLKSDVGVTTVSNKVSSWADQSGNGRDVTQGTDANRPTLTAGEINGLPGVVFSAVDHRLLWAAGFAQQATGTTYIVYKTNTATTNAFLTVVGAAAVAVNQMAVWGGTIKAAQYFGTQGAIHEHGTTLSAGAWHYVRWSHDLGVADLSRISVDGGADADVSTITQTALGDYVSVSHNVNGNHFLGSIAEFIVYHSVLSAGDHALVADYLAARYGL